MRKRINRTIIFILILLLMSLFQIIGQWDTELNKDQITPLHYLMEDESFLENDFYTQENLGFNVRFFFLKVLSGINIFTNNHDLSWVILLFFAYFATSITIFTLLTSISRDRTFAFLTTLMLHAVSWNQLGGLTLFERRPNIIAYFFIFLALNLFYHKKSILGYFVLGLAVLFQPIAGLLFFTASVFCNSWEYLKKLNIKRLITKNLPTLAFFPVALINLIPLYTLNEKTKLYGIKYEIIQMSGLFWHPNHTDPLYWSMWKYLIFFAFIIAVFTVLKKVKLQYNIKKYITPYIISIILFSIAGFSILFYPVTLFVKAQMFRSLIPFSLFGYFIISKYLYDKTREQDSILGKIYYIGIVTLFFYSKAVLIAVPLILISLKWNIPDSLKKVKLTEKLVYSIAIATIISLTIFSKTLVEIIPKVYFIVLIKIILFIIFAMAIYMKRNLIIPTILILIALIFVINVSDWSPDQGCPNSISVKEYSKENTPKDAIFLIPPELIEFRLCAMRAVVIDINSVFTDNSIIKSRERLLDVTQVEDFNNRINHYEINEYYFKLTEKQVNEISTKYNATYFLTSIENKDKFSFNDVYSDKEYVLYEL